MHALRKHRPLRRVTLAAATTVTGLVLLLALKPHTPPAVARASSSAGRSPSQSRAPSRTPASANTGSTGTRTVTGDSVQTRWGPVQVRVTLKNGEITDVTAVASPTGNPRDEEINAYAIPQLRREALAAQSARIDSVSGASYTSDGYKRSLQSALDSAGL